MIPYLNTQNGGIIRTVIFVLLILIVLAYFGFNLRAIISSPTFQDNWAFVRGLVVDVWTKYLSGMFNFVINKIIVPFVWNPAIDSLKRSGTGTTTVTATTGSN